MSELRIGRGWQDDALLDRLSRARRSGRNFSEREAGTTAARGWSRHLSEAIIAREPPGPPQPGGPFERAWPLLERYAFSDPRIVSGHFEPGQALLGRVMLVEATVLGLHYLGAVVVSAVQHDKHDDREVRGFRYDTLDGHFERGFEWFRVTKMFATGDITLTIDAHWRRGELPNAWSRLGFTLLAPRYQRAWHRLAHLRMREMLGSSGLPPLPRGARLVHTGPPIPLVPVQAAADGPPPDPIVSRNRTGAGRRRQEHTVTRDMMTAYAVGAIGGSRSMLAPALVASPAMRTWLAVLAAGEMVADKTPRIPARTRALPLIGRAVMGALAGLRIAPRANRITAAAMGAAGAISAAYALYHLRRIATTRYGVPNVAAGLAEDAIALGAGAMLLNRRSR